MPTTLPVPSKGALRTLRHLALGTSCTVALSAGLLTEDRRRRIHAAREVHRNAQKLKSSKKYHSSGIDAIETFEQQVSRLQDDAFWLPSNVARSKLADTAVSSEVAEKPNIHTKNDRRTSAESKIVRRSYQPISAPIAPTRLNFPKANKQTVRNREQRLSCDVIKLLDEDPPDVRSAFFRFLEAFEEGLVEDGLEIPQVLLDAAIRLSVACMDQRRYDDSERIFDVIVAHGPLEEEDYHRFKPREMIYRLLQQSDNNGTLEITKLRKAASIYLTKFKGSPRSMSEEMQSIGQTLCKETFNSGLFKLCVEIHFRISKCVTGGSLHTITYLIKATHALGQHKRMSRYFHNFFAQNTPSPEEFHEVTDLVIDSLLKLNNFNEAERILLAAASLAKRTKSQLATTWFLKLLGHHWRLHHDIASTRALFERLKPSENIRQALHATMIQFYIEAGDQIAAAALFDQMQLQFKLSPRNLGVYGHFALAKAMQGDWDGVKADLQMMRKRNPEDAETFNASFVPILKVYLKAHTISECEDFIRYYMETCRLSLSTYIMNIMVNAYAKSREIDSLDRWIRFSTSQGCSIDSTTLNTLIQNLCSSWNFSYGEIYLFYSKLRSIPGASALFVDNQTISLLRRLATLGTKDERVVANRLAHLKWKTAPQNIFNNENVSLKMLTSAGIGNMNLTLQTYEDARERNLFLGPEDVHLAVNASLKISKQHFSITANLIREAQKRGIDVSRSITAVFQHHLTTAFENGERDRSLVVRVTRSTIALFQSAEISIPPSVLTHTTSILQRSGHNRQAIEFWKAMSQRLNLTASIDITTCTILCKAYSAMLDCAGVKSVVDSIEANNIAPDNKFKVMLKVVQKTVVELLIVEPNHSQARQFLACILEVRQRVKRMRCDLVSAKKEVEWKVMQIMEMAVAEQSSRREELKIADDRLLERVDSEIELDTMEEFMETEDVAEAVRFAAAAY